MILCDAHVHVYPCFDPLTLLDAASKNFDKAAREYFETQQHGAVLWLTECANHDFFGRISRPDAGPIGRWSFSSTEDACAVIARREDKSPIIVVAGRQIVTHENLEVLALGTIDRFPDGETTQLTIRKVEKSGALPILPWGFGKWLGRRGALLRTLLEDLTLPAVYLGDNGGRPGFLRPPSSFLPVGRESRPVLPGTDPLPFPHESSRPGGFGFAIDAALDTRRPASTLKALIGDPATRIHSYGSSEMPLRFIRHQLAMQLNKRRSATPQ